MNDILNIFKKTFKLTIKIIIFVLMLLILLAIVLTPLLYIINSSIFSKNMEFILFVLYGLFLVISTIIIGSKDIVESINQLNQLFKIVSVLMFFVLFGMILGFVLDKLIFLGNISFIFITIFICSGIIIVYDNE